MKRIIAIVLCCIFATLTPVRESKANSVAIFCIAISIILVVGVKYVEIKVCRPRWFCVYSDELKDRICTSKQPREWESDWVCLADVHYDSMEKCRAGCSNLTAKASSPQEITNPIWVFIERSTNLVTWEAIGVVMGEKYSDSDIQFETFRMATEYAIVEGSPTYFRTRLEPRM